MRRRRTTAHENAISEETGGEVKNNAHSELELVELQV